MARYLKLERMEINGFKSFYGRTRFDFPEGITAVVGPNGCGKSNIGDAISWVLGEQKASSLRSDRMEDVIFNGSQGRKPLGMAEVSLHFRNIMPPRSGSECGTIDREATGPAPVMEPGNGNGNGNGHGNGNGNGHGGATAAAVVAAVEEAAPAPDAMVEDVESAAALAETPALADAPGCEEAVQADPAPGARFVLEDLPGEVVLTRRLFRSGESEYALNGERCRLKDIQDLLARTEIGTRLYTTIEQGKIDQILVSKPKERRLIIEEAAGILGFRTKRRQTEQKLEATQANLLRIADITGEVEKQIQSLRRQAAKARRYRKLMETLREQRGVIAARRLKRLDAEREENAKALQDLDGRMAETSAGLGRSEADLEALRQKLDAAEAEARRRRDGLHALDMEIDRLQSRLRSDEEQRQDLEGRAAEAAREIESLCLRAAVHEARRGSLTEELQAEAARVQDAEASLARIEAEQRERAAAIAAAEADLEARRSALLSLIDRVGEIGRRRASLEAQALAADASLERLGREAGEAAASGDTLRAEVASEAGCVAARRAEQREREARHERLAEETRGADESLAAIEKRLEEQRGRAAALEERREALSLLESRRAGLSEGVAGILAGGGGFAPRGIVGERLEVPTGLDRAVAAVLGRLQEGILVATPEEATRGVAHLRGGAGGRASFVQESASGSPAAASAAAAVVGRPGVRGRLADEVRGAEPVGVIAARLASAVVVDTLDRGLDLRGEFPGVTFVTLAGDLVDADGVVVGGDGPELLHGLLARRAEQADLAAQIATLERERAASEEAVAAQRREMESLRESLQRSAADLQAEERELFQAEHQLGARSAELARLDLALPLLSSEAERLRRECLARREEMAAVETESQALDGRRQEAEEAIRDGASRLAARRAEFDQSQRGAGEARAHVAAGGQRLAAMARERETVESGIGDLRQREGQRAAEREAWTARVADLATQDTTLREGLDKALSARAEAASQDEAALAGLAYDRSLLQARESAAREAREAASVLQRERQDQEVRAARLASDLEHLESNLREDLGLTLEALRAAPPAYDEQRPLEEDEAEVLKAKEALEAIGPVNLMAIEQCAELEERSGFLNQQKADLEASVDSLRDTIRRINRESRERFTQAFEAIMAGFQESFTALFGGGRAELKLQDDEEDVLEAGIEIAAQPPGKRLQSLALLSGGEKALTAVALLFSLFRYRPSPFCVMDEVDAPLDEANVERFTGLLRQFADDTQFILITHNRKSMEAANLLYGVTMEEPGVSKVLPLRFE
jgi:chromosome segregation protein